METLKKFEDYGDMINNIILTGFVFDIVSSYTPRKTITESFAFNLSTLEI